MALGSTQPLTEMSTRSPSGGGGKGRPARGADNITAICEPIVYKMCEPRRLTSLWAFTFTFLNGSTAGKQFENHWSTPVVFNLGYAYPRGYAKTS
jgi:hypothetical protein